MAQQTFTPNDISDYRERAYALQAGKIFVDADTVKDNATLLIRNGMVEAVVDGHKAPKGYVVKDLAGAWVYPGLIDLDSDYGLPDAPKKERFGWNRPEVVSPQRKGPYNANDAIKADFAAVDVFVPDDSKAGKLREKGFSVLLVSRKDGIASGRGALVSLADVSANEAVINSRASSHFSFDKGSSKQTYPISIMGFVSLLRQTYLDAEWYASLQEKPFADVTLQSFVENRNLPSMFRVNGWNQLLVADRIGDEFSVPYIMRGAGDEYQRLENIRNADVRLVIPVDFPDAMDVEDAFDAKSASLKELKHWELAPHNPAILSEAGVDFAITSSGSGKDFWKNISQAVSNGLGESKALEALTITPARFLGEEHRLGHLHKGAMANFIVTGGSLFSGKPEIRENWIQGRYHHVSDMPADSTGVYQLTMGERSFELDVKSKGAEIRLPEQEEGIKADFKQEKGLVTLSFSMAKGEGAVRLSGWSTADGFAGKGQMADGSWQEWQAIRQSSDVTENEKSDKAGKNARVGEMIYPFTGFGQTELPKAERILFRNATVWTNEQDGILDAADVLVANGKIVKVGKGLQDSTARVVDAEGKHLTAGIIDEHSHIALNGVNDVATNSGMVRMMDSVDSEDADIYRNLAGGVTAAQLLHGSANPIGGQSAMIKMRWGKTPGELMVKGAAPFNKFALGENVKRSRNAQSIRYPQTRMGVEQVYMDGFARAVEYRKAHKAWMKMSKRERSGKLPPRRDLALEALAEIVAGERFITTHSYVQSEINMLMKVAEHFDFKVNTFTHILEGYKVADIMAEHGAGASTFSDWWNYKWEVKYAIPYNAALMEEAGVLTAINSDSAEMSRRLNQEAAKAVKYGGVSEEDAWKMVTLNPAKLLHLDDRMGSIKVGKDADVVLWNGHPMSISSRAEMTLVDGVVYFSLEKDKALQGWTAEERHRLIQKMRAEGKGKKGKRKPESKVERDFHCDSLHGYEYLLGQHQHQE